MKVTGVKRVKWGTDGWVELSEPSNEQWNEYQKRKYPISRRGQAVTNDAHAAAIWLFDELYLAHGGLEDQDGEIPLAALDRLPGRYKALTVQKLFELEDDVEEAGKN